MRRAKAFLFLPPWPRGALKILTALPTSDGPSHHPKTIEPFNQALFGRTGECVGSRSQEFVVYS